MKKIMTILCIIETLLISVIHIRILPKLHGIGIYNNNGDIMVFSVMEFILFYLMGLYVLQMWFFVIKGKRFNFLLFLSLATLLELMGCLLYHIDFIVLICFIGIFPLMVIYTVLYKKNGKYYEKEYFFNNKTRYIMTIVSLLVIFFNIIYIIYPKEKAYYYYSNNYHFVEFKFDKTYNIDEADNEYYIFKEFLYPIHYCIGKQYKARGGQSGLAEVTIGMGHHTTDVIRKDISYQLDTNGKFRHILSLDYICKVYAFNIATIFMFSLYILYIWVLKKLVKL